MAALLAGGSGTRGGCITGLDYTGETKQAQGEARGSRLGGAWRGRASGAAYSASGQRGSRGAGADVVRAGLRS